MKNSQKSLLVLLLLMAVGLPVQAKEIGGKKKRASNFIAACAPAQAQIDMDINNVRARLLTGGDMWWDRNDGKYVVPKPLPGQPEVTAIYAAGIWLGGFDPGGNLKIACQTYGSGGDNDYWPGPLSEDEGITDPQTCNDWDRHFEIKGTDIQLHLSKYQQAQDGQQPYLESEIPLSVKGWPARGNPYFTQVHGFSLPNTDQGLADFYDQDGDGNYEPVEGDFPTVVMRGCNYEPMFPDQMVFWIYNDEGSGAIHEETHGIPIRMEIQATAFAFSTFDPLNDMTFQRHKFINRAKEDLDSTYFGLWADTDLGCYLDDYFGCDPERNLAYYYNRDAEDGQPGITCNGVPTYGYNIPALGIDIFRGPLDENGLELGMSSFIYIGNPSLWDGHPGGIAPQNDIDFFRFLSGTWRDGTPLTYGGDGYNPSSTDITNYVFPSSPNDLNGWSMCEPGFPFPNGLPAYDRQSLQSCGPFLLQPGAVNELIFGVIFAPNIDYPCPDLSRLFAADDYAQAIFDNCEAFLYGPDGPDAPDVDWVAGDRQITGILTNPSWSNNANEDFETPVFGHPKWATDATYNFEGYLVFQTARNEFQLTDIYDTTKTRLVFQSDLANEFSTVRNWKAIRNPNYQLVPGSEQFLYLPNESIAGGNEGLQHEFTITEDLFAKGDDRRLVNHRNYYYVALAYASNNFEPFNPSNGMGQKTMYLIGRRNIGPNADGSPYVVLPRPAQGGLDKVQIVPNPFYNASAYADSEGNGVLKITNLPAKCEVSIFTLDGKVVKLFNRNEVPAPPFGSGIAEQQIYPDLIWDLKNENGKTIASGIYLVRIRAEGIGEITLKAVVI